MEFKSDLRSYVDNSYSLSRALAYTEFERVRDINLFFYANAFAAAIGMVTLAGFPPLAGFFLKLTVAEALVAHGAYFILAAILLLTLVSMFAYYNVLIHFKLDRSRVVGDVFTEFKRHWVTDRLNGFDFMVQMLLVVAAVFMTFLIWNNDLL